jgi:hypothetical protein
MYRSGVVCEVENLSDKAFCQVPDRHIDTTIARDRESSGNRGRAKRQGTAFVAIPMCTCSVCGWVWEGVCTAWVRAPGQTGANLVVTCHGLRMWFIVTLVEREGRW